MVYTMYVLLYIAVILYPWTNGKNIYMANDRICFQAPEVCEDEGTEKEQNKTWQRVVSNFVWAYDKNDNEATIWQGVDMTVCKEVVRLAPVSDLHANLLLKLWFPHQKLNLEIFEKEFKE